MNNYEMEKTEKVKKELDRLQNLVLTKVDLYNASYEDIENFNESIYYMIDTLKPLIREGWVMKQQDKDFILIMAVALPVPLFFIIATAIIY